MTFAVTYHCGICGKTSVINMERYEYTECPYCTDNKKYLSIKKDTNN